MDPDHVDIVVHELSGDIVVFLSPEVTAALAVLLHVVEDHPTHKLSPRLLPLMRVLDRKLVGYTKTAG